MDNISRSTIFGAYPKWQRMPIPLEHKTGNSWSSQLNDSWKCTTKQTVVICHVRDFSTNTFGSMRHLITKFVNRELYRKNPLMATRFSDDPTYNEKVYVLQALGVWKKIAVEVFPTQVNTVDAANLYHIWEFDDANRLPFDISPIQHMPESFEDTVTLDDMNEVEFSLHTICTEKTSPNSVVGYLYLRSKNGSELKWKQKQLLKNTLAGPHVTAVEVLSPELRNLGYTCLVCLPFGYELDFGIHSHQ